jgi:hypothetical protein
MICPKNFGRHTSVPWHKGWASLTKSSVSQSAQSVSCFIFFNFCIIAGSKTNNTKYTVDKSDSSNDQARKSGGKLLDWKFFKELIV